jgi:hypothetical protein
MEIKKIYSHKILSDNKKIIPDTKISKFIKTFYDECEYNKPVDFLQNNNNYSKKCYDRIPNGSILFDKVSKDKYGYGSELDFILSNMNSHTDKKLSNKLKKYFTKDWHDCLIFYDLSFMSYLFLQFFEYECDKLIKLSNGKHKINIIYSSKITSNDEINNIIFHILKILNWLTNKYNKDHEILLNILLSPFEKSYCNKLNDKWYEMYDWANWTKDIKVDGLGPININTGVSWKYQGNNTITLFRTDEIFKVLIHELIHNLNLDFHNCDTCEELMAQCVTLHIGDDISYPVIYNEAYVEYFAILLWNHYLASYYVSGGSTIVDKYKLYCHMIKNEITNSAIQCKKLFDYYNIKSFEIFSNNNNIKQYTNAFSYVFIKYILLVNQMNLQLKELHTVDALKFNQQIKSMITDLSMYNYLFDVITDKSCKLKLSIYKIV